MKKILSSVLKKKVIKSINKLGNGVQELIIEIPLSFGTCDSIELDSEDGVYLHIFKEGDLDIVTNFDDISEEDQLKVIKILYTV